MSKLRCIGAIYGDIIGSRFEFSKSITLDFPLFINSCSYTDDTVLTIAVMDYFNNKRENNISYYFKKWYNKYPNSGFGYRFSVFCESNSSKPYNSFGNGSAMRVSPVAYVARNLDECLKLAKESAEVTHNHPEGIKGAEVIAGAIYLAINHKTKEEIKDFVIKYYSKFTTYDLESLHIHNKFDETIPGSINEALYAFFSSNSLEDCVRRCNYIGGDSDTIGAIACSIAEPFYGIKDQDVDTVLSYLPKDIKEVIINFNKLLDNTK